VAEILAEPVLQRKKKSISERSYFEEHTESIKSSLTTFGEKI